MRHLHLVLAPVVVFLLSLVSPIAAQTDLTGEWELEFTTPRGHLEFMMYLKQEGPRVTGHLTSEYGERDVRVSVKGEEITITWAEVDGGKTIDVTLTGTVKGDHMSGTAKLGTVGEGPFKAERTGG